MTVLGKVGNNGTDFAQKRRVMNKKKILLSVLMVLLLVIVLSAYLASQRRPGGTIVSGNTDGGVSERERLGRRVLPDMPDRIPTYSEDEPRPRKPSEAVRQVPSSEPEGSPPEVLEKLPSQWVEAAPAIKRSVPEPPAVVSPPEKERMKRFCGGELISQCVDCGLSHGDFALLLVDILALKAPETLGEVFEILESLHVGPVGGWAKANLQKRMTAEEMEEVRCSISLAAEEGLIEMGPSVVTAAVNRFCRELKVSLEAMEDSGIVKNRGRVAGETGYQGGTRGIASSPF